jgi:hypothetical protein
MRFRVAGCLDLIFDESAEIWVDSIWPHNGLASSVKFEMMGIFITRLSVIGSFDGIGEMIEN